MNIADATIGTESSPGKTTLLSDIWIKDNTLSDIKHLTEKLSGTTNNTEKTRLEQEMIAVLPPTEDIPDGLVNAEDKAEIDTDSENDAGANEEKSQNKAERIKCKKQNTNTRWWKSTGKCEESKTIAKANYANGGNGKLYTRVSSTDGGGSDTWGNNIAGAVIDTTGKYIQYTSNEIMRILAGKTLTITLINPIPTDGKRYIADFG